jgi:hypothetical protein
MANNEQQALLDALKRELEFCEEGRYKPCVGRFPARATENDPRSSSPFGDRRSALCNELSVFQDSPSCPNHGSPARDYDCSECWLIHFVPYAKRGAAVPCHHIPLNERGDTVASLGGPADAPKVQEALVGWLRNTIQQLESEIARGLGAEVRQRPRPDDIVLRRA